jgi:deoxyadenosine/deoxycytidine kinase
MSSTFEKFNTCTLNLKGFNSIVNKRNPPKFIVIDGLIGAGKTTLIKLLINKYSASGIKVHPIYEPVDVWRETGALAEFYKDIKAKCYEFQTFVYITRIQRVIDEVCANPDTHIFLLERSIFTDRYIFVNLLKENMGPVRLEMYNTWWDMWSCLMNIKIHKWVLLDTSLNESINRICNRARGEEHGITVEYQKNLMDKHHEFYTDLKNKGEAVCIIPSSLMDSNFIETGGSKHLADISNMILENVN